MARANAARSGAFSARGAARSVCGTSRLAAPSTRSGFARAIVSLSVAGLAVTLRGALLGLSGAAALATPPQPAAPQSFPAQDDDELLLPETISTADIELRGRYARQWRADDGTLVVVFQGGFRLLAGQRRMSAEDGVVWIASGWSQESARKFYDLTVYLWRAAEVREPSGTVTNDEMLLVSNLRTFGRVVKLHDAHAPERLEELPLYQQAVRDRVLIESQLPESDAGLPTVEVAKPEEARPTRPQRPPRVIRYRLPPLEPATTTDGRQVLVARGRSYFSESSSAGGPLLEISADNAVVFAADEGSVGSILESGMLGETPADGNRPSDTVPQEPPPDESRPQEAPPGQAGIQRELQKRIAGVYLEGDVALSRGDRFVRADRLYYDFERDRALILDSVFRAEIPSREIPLYVRADEIRQLSAREYRADRARISTSEFFTPHYHVGADRIYIRDTTVRDSAGRGATATRGEYELRNATLNVENVPLLWWPASRGNFEESETALRSFRTGYTDRFGLATETRWNLLTLLGVPHAPGFDANLRLDYYSKRGPGAGVDLDYAAQDYFGLLRSYYLHDTGEDSLGPLANNQPESENRGRVLLRHRQFLPEDWQATFEISYVGDPNYLQEWEKSEFFEGKDQETLFYLKRARGVEAVSLLANWRLLDFVTQTEHLPDLNYRRIGDVLDPLVFYHESRIGMVRYRPDDRRWFDTRRLDNLAATDTTFRVGAREEVELPLKLGPVNLVPFGVLRGDYWDGTPSDGSKGRGLASYGVRGGTQFHKVYDDIESELLDVHRVRHIVKPEFALWNSHANVESRRLTPFDEGVESIDDFYGALVALKQVWQTKRGAADQQRSVDLLTLNLEAGFFGRQQPHEMSNGFANPIRPEDSRTRNYIAAEAIWRLSDTTALLYDVNYDVNDQSFDRHNVSLAVERLPRLAYLFGLRYAGDIDSNLVGGGFNYKLSEKHSFAFREWYDIERGENGEIAVGYIRKLPRWYFAVNFEYDNIDDDMRVSVSLWPEGIPEWTFGSRRFTNVSSSTGIRPER